METPLVTLFFKEDALYHGRVEGSHKKEVKWFSTWIQWHILHHLQTIPGIGQLSPQVL